MYKVHLNLFFSNAVWRKKYLCFNMKSDLGSDFCPLGCYRPIKNINLYAKFSIKSLILRKKVTLKLPKQKIWSFQKTPSRKILTQNDLIIP